MRLAAPLPSIFAFEDEPGDQPALRLRIGPARSHRDVTYAELRALVPSAGGGLLEAGCAPGDRVALLMPHSERLIVTFLGALYAGLVPSILAWPTVKMDPEKYRRNINAVVGNLDADVLVTDGATEEALGSALGRTRVVSAPPSTRGCRADVRREGPAFIQFSGGTTGTQKSVPISYRHLERQLESYASVLGLQATDRIISWLPLYHDMGLIACLLLPVAFRLPVSLLAPMEWVMDPRGFLEVIQADRATHCWLPNFAFSFMASRAKPAGQLDLSSMRAVVNCSEPVRAESMDAFVSVFERHGLAPSALHACYAMAEATFAVTQTTDRDPPRRLEVSKSALGRGRLERGEGAGRVLISCGPPLPGVEVRIVGSGGEACEAGVVGEIQIRGGFVMDGYHEHGGAEGRWAFVDGWYRTGDLGACLDGHVYVTGRKKDVIIVGGINIYPEDLEAAASELPGIHPGRVAAIGIEDASVGTERLVIVAEADSQGDLARAPELEAALRRTTLEVCGVAPHRVWIVPPKWIVKSTAGKISRAETKARVEARWNELTSSSLEGSVAGA